MPGFSIKIQVLSEDSDFIFLTVVSIGVFVCETGRSRGRGAMSAVQYLQISCVLWPCSHHQL